ncbi:hypothetical protein R1flu_000349 [Riccia fluitans]|uniref:Uncharacterized protein n=1 Tax=Riccia fluitans TaxID=41844 RepID=A0ABD1Y075_9MARC
MPGFQAAGGKSSTKRHLLLPVWILTKYTRKLNGLVKEKEVSRGLTKSFSGFPSPLACYFCLQLHGRKYRLIFCPMDRRYTRRMPPVYLLISKELKEYGDRILATTVAKQGGGHLQDIFSDPKCEAVFQDLYEEDRIPVIPCPKI